ncbi:murein hydrolase activator EnvC [Histophilus somni]
MLFLRQKFKNRLKLTALFYVVYLLFSFVARANELTRLQEKIKLQEQKIAQQKNEQNELQNVLKNQENKISQAEDKLRQTEENLKETQQLINTTDKQIKRLEMQLKSQKKLLAEQIDKMYRAEINSSAVEKLFSQEAQKSERMQIYYRQMNQTRLKLINEIQQTQEQLENEKALIQGKRKNQQNQLTTQKQQRQELQKLQREQQLMLEQLNQNLVKDQNKLEQLKANEITLRQQIQRAEKITKEKEQRERAALARKKESEERKNRKPYKPTAQEKQLMASKKGLGVAKKQYSFPVQGKVVQGFGTSQMGELKWKGMVISAVKGSPVKVITDGRVILVSRLAGYGLMVIVKHGEYDLTLYGYNQSAMVEEGQFVKAGQKIAEVGDTGSYALPALYFEICRKGIPVNPMGWVK